MSETSVLSPLTKPMVVSSSFLQYLIEVLSCFISSTIDCCILLISVKSGPWESCWDSPTHPSLTLHIVVPWDLSIPISMSADQISTELMTPQKQTSAKIAITEPLITNHPLPQNFMSPQELQGIDPSRS